MNFLIFILYFRLMKKRILTFVCVLACLISFSGKSQTKIVIIRHAEKQDKIENLSCMGFNRSLKLVNVLYKKIGVPNYIYVPSIGNGVQTTHSRMFQTISPFVIKYNVSINSAYKGGNFDQIVKDLDQKTGTILMVWDHENIKGLAKALGIKTKKLDWSGNDFDSIWMITGKGKNRVLTIDHEGIVPAAGCPAF